VGLRGRSATPEPCPARSDAPRRLAAYRPLARGVTAWLGRLLDCPQTPQNVSRATAKRGMQSSLQQTSHSIFVATRYSSYPLPETLAQRGCLSPLRCHCLLIAARLWPSGTHFDRCISQRDATSPKSDQITEHAVSAGEGQSKGALEPIWSLF